MELEIDMYSYLTDNMQKERLVGCMRARDENGRLLTYNEMARRMDRSSGSLRLAAKNIRDSDDVARSQAAIDCMRVRESEKRLRCAGKKPAKRSARPAQTSNVVQKATPRSRKSRSSAASGSSTTSVAIAGSSTGRRNLTPVAGQMGCLSSAAAGTSKDRCTTPESMDLNQAQTGQSCSMRRSEDASAQASTSDTGGTQAQTSSTPLANDSSDSIPDDKHKETMMAAIALVGLKTGQFLEPSQALYKTVLHFPSPV